MANPVTKLDVKKEREPAEQTVWHPLEAFRREIDRAFGNFAPFNWPFSRSLDLEPFAGRELNWAKMPAVDVVEKDGEYQITAELPGIDEKNVEVKLANGVLTVQGEKKEEKEEKKADYHLMERHYGSFQRSFRLPDGVDAENVSAAFKNGVLSITLPKSAAAKAQEKKIPIKTA